MRTYKHYQAGDLVGEFPWPDKEPVTEKDWTPVPPEGVYHDEGARKLFAPRGVPTGEFVPCLATTKNETRVYRELNGMYLARLRAQRTGNWRWDWLRYLGLLGRRTGAGGHLLPSGTWWGKLLGRPAKHEYVSATEPLVSHIQ